MKQIFLFSMLLLAPFLLFAQAPQTLSYQGVARNAQGQPYANQTIAVRLKIHDLVPAGTIVYSEVRTTTTNAFGLFTIVINGAGGTKTGDFTTIDWNTGAKYLETEIDASGGSSFTSIGTTPMQSVPYALQSAKAAKLNLPYSEESDQTIALLTLRNTGAGHALTTSNSGSGRAFAGSSASNTAIYGLTTSASSQHAAVHGYAPMGSASGVFGESGSTGIGVEAVNNGSGLALSVSGRLKIAGGNTSPGSGKVLTSDASGNATWQNPSVGQKISFSVRGIALGGLQNLPNGQWLKLHCQTEEHDPGNDYTLFNQGGSGNPTSTFIAPVSGVYQFNAQATISGCCQTYILKNGDLRIMVQRGSTSFELMRDQNVHPDGFRSDVVAKASISTHLQAGDRVWVEIWGRTESGVNPHLQHSPALPDYSLPYHFFSGYLVHAD